MDNKFLVDTHFIYGKYSVTAAVLMVKITDMLCMHYIWANGLRGYQVSNTEQTCVSRKILCRPRTVQQDFEHCYFTSHNNSTQNCNLWKQIPYFHKLLYRQINRKESASVAWVQSNRGCLHCQKHLQPYVLAHSHHADKNVKTYDKHKNLISHIRYSMQCLSSTNTAQPCSFLNFVVDEYNPKASASTWKRSVRCNNSAQDEHRQQKQQQYGRLQEQCVQYIWTTTQNMA